MASIFGNLSSGQKKLGLTVAAMIGAALLGAVGYYFPSASNEGYMPEQPIPFSHKLHAGDNKIDCKYCHVGATRSAHATVPAMNVCMNCHSVVRLDSPHIQKLHEHYKQGKPIEWVRVHELPDHARFNHKRHVTKGVSCETCHGDVAAMDVIFQAKPLTMGWCLDCHRNRDAPGRVKTLVKPDAPEGEPLAPFSCSTCHY